MARPSEYNFQLCEEICEGVAAGGNVINVLERNEDYPSWSTFRRWKNENEELQTLYVKAIQDKSEAVALEIDNICQDLKNKIYDPATANVLIQTLKWKAAKFYPKMYGDKTTIEATIEGKGSIDIEKWITANADNSDK